MSRPRFKTLIGYGVAAACLAWLFYGLNWSRLLEDLRGIRWGWVALGIVFDILGFVCQGWRWALLLRPTGRISVPRATQAIYAGLFTNEVLPMRVGELVRGLMVARWMSLDLSAVVPSIVLERFFDIVWLAVCIALTTMFVPLPKDLLRAADILGAVVLLATAGLLYIVLRESASGRPPRSHGRVMRWLAKIAGRLEGGLKQIGRSRVFYLSLAVSLLFLLGKIMAFWLIMWAYGLHYSFWVGTVVLLVVQLGTALPNAPANLGTYQFSTVVGLALFGVGKTVAAGFSLVVFFLLTLPLWIIGSVALSRGGMTLGEIRLRAGL
jgi:uncharacterized protein (TIRG00374 family)